MTADTATATSSVRRRTYEQLKALILSHAVRPAEKLSEIALAKRLGVSRTPLREALMKLEEEGLVTSERNVGYTVADLDIETVCHLLEVRKALDVLAAELACDRASDDDLAAIRDVVRQIGELRKDDTSAENMARRLELGLEIHRVVVKATGNEALLRATDQIYQQLRLALWMEVLWVELGDSDYEEHRAIAEAIGARDREAAARAAAFHVQSSLENLVRLNEVTKLRRLPRGV